MVEHWLAIRRPWVQYLSGAMIGNRIMPVTDDHENDIKKIIQFSGSNNDVKQASINRCLNLKPTIDLASR